MMLNASTTQETAAPTQGLTPNLAFPLERLERKPAIGTCPRASNIYQSDTRLLNLKDQTANGQALKCMNDGATTVSVKFDLALTITRDVEYIQPYDLTLELGSINDQGVYTPTQAYTGDILQRIFADLRLDRLLDRPTVYPRQSVSENLKIEDAKATQNLVIRITEKQF